MADFTIDDLIGLWDEGDTYRVIISNINLAQENFSWWCLGHNFDVVGAILSMADLSWQKGFDAGIAIADFAARPTDCTPGCHRYDGWPTNVDAIDIKSLQ